MMSETSAALVRRAQKGLAKMQEPKSALTNDSATLETTAIASVAIASLLQDLAREKCCDYGLNTKIGGSI